MVFENANFPDYQLYIIRPGNMKKGGAQKHEIVWTGLKKPFRKYDQ